MKLLSKTYLTLFQWQTNHKLSPNSKPFLIPSSFLDKPVTETPAEIVALPSSQSSGLLTNKEKSK